MKIIKAIAVLVLITSTAFSQTPAQNTKHLIIAEGYPGTLHANTRIPVLLHTPPDAIETLAKTGHIGQKYPVIVFFHGAGESTDNFTSPTSVDTSELNDLYTTAPMSALRYTTSSLYGLRYSSPGGSENTQFFYAAPQTYGGYNYTFLVYPHNVIKWIKENYSHIIDTNRIYLTGLSLGGGAVNCAIQDSLINRQVAAAAPICPGYRTYSGFVPTGSPQLVGSSYFNWGLVARSGLPVWWFHGNADNTTVGCSLDGATGNSMCSTRMIDSINRRSPVGQMLFYHYTTTSHTIWDWVYLPSQENTSHSLVTGESPTMGLRLEEWFLQYSTHGYRRGTIK